MILLIIAILIGVPVPPIIQLTPASYAVVLPPLPPKTFTLVWTRPNDEKALSVSVFETQDLRKDWNFVTNVPVVITNIVVPNQYPNEFFKALSVNAANLDSAGIVEQLNN